MPLTVSDNAAAPAADLRRHLGTIAPFWPISFERRLVDLESRDAAFVKTAADLRAQLAVAEREYEACVGRIANATASAADIQRATSESLEEIRARFVAPGEAMGRAHEEFRRSCRTFLLDCRDLLLPIVNREIDRILSGLKETYDALGVPFVVADQPISSNLGRWRPLLRQWLASDATQVPGPSVVREIIGRPTTCPDPVAPEVIQQTALKTAAEIVTKS